LEKGLDDDNVRIIPFEPVTLVIMASMAMDGDMRKNLLDRTDAEKVFRGRILNNQLLFHYTIFALKM
jgi:hypothetical protein